MILLELLLRLSVFQFSLNLSKNICYDRPSLLANFDWYKLQKNTSPQCSLLFFNGISKFIPCFILEELPYCYTYHPCWDPLINILHYIIYLKFALMPGSSWQLSLTSAATVATPHRLSNNPILWKKEIFSVKFWMRLVHFQYFRYWQQGKF